MELQEQMNTLRSEMAADEKAKADEKKKIADELVKLAKERATKDHDYPSSCSHYPTVSLHRLFIDYRWYWNIYQFVIAYAFRPRLRSRLTLGGQTFPRKPWTFDGKDSHLAFRYSCRHSHLITVHRTLRFGFSPVIIAPLPIC